MQHPDGIYFNLPEEDHHADTALGYSDHKALIFNPPRWQWKRLKGLREDLGLGDKETEGETAAKEFGKAVHKMVLEGQEAFDETYYVAGDPPEGLLSSISEMREALAECWANDPAQPKPLIKSAARPDHVRECKNYGLPLIDDWREAEAERRGEREELSRTWAAAIRMIGRLLDAKRADHGGKSIREKTLVDGYPEVSVFWTVETALGPLRLKARFDWLRPRIVIEPKTYGCRDGWETVDSFCKAVKDFGYDVQAAHYADALAALPELVSHGKVFGDVDPEWLERLVKPAPAGEPQWTWDWLAIQTIGLPEVDILNFPLNGMVALSAKAQVEWARQRYVQYRDTFGEDALWVEGRSRIILDDINFNSNIANRGVEKWRPHAPAQIEG